MEVNLTSDVCWE